MLYLFIIKNHAGNTDMLILFFGCGSLNLFNLGDKFSATETAILPSFDCSMAENVSGAKNYQDFLGLRITPPSVPFAITQVHAKSLVIEDQECDVHSVDYQLFFHLMCFKTRWKESYLSQIH